MDMRYAFSCNEIKERHRERDRKRETERDRETDRQRNTPELNLLNALFFLLSALVRSGILEAWNTCASYLI